MKNITVIFFSLLSLSILFSCTENTPRPKVKKKVKTTNVAKYTAEKVEGDTTYKIGAYDATHLTQLTFFNEKEQLTKKAWSDLNRKTVFMLSAKNDENGLNKSATMKDMTNKIISRLEYEVDEKGKKTVQRTLSSKKKLERTDEYFYDDKGNLNKEIRKNAKGEVTETTFYTINENGDPIEMSIEYPNHQTYYEKYSYKKFNKEGDWTQKYIIIDGKVTHIVNRNVYYHEKK